MTEKTSKHFKDVPFAEIKGQFAVVRESSRKMHFSNVHADVLDAITEAERLNVEDGVRYLVVKCVAIIGF